jgi:hypothetical protein
MVATVEDGRLVSLRPDRDHELSSGFACQKIEPLAGMARLTGVPVRVEPAGKAARTPA